MNTWILVLVIYAGPLANGDSVSVTSVSFSSEKSCRAAIQPVTSLVKGSYKVARAVCVKDEGRSNG